MAKLSNINGKFAVEDTGAIRFSDQAGTTGQILKSNGNSAPTWVDPNTVGTGPWLPLAGGIVSGPTTFQSTLTVGGTLTGTSATFNGLMKLDAGGILQFANNTATPSMGVAIHRSAVDTLNFVTDSTERMRIESGGNIRVNFNQSGSYGNLYFQDIDNGASMFYLQPAVYKGSAPYNTNYINAANSTNIGFITGGSERMRINSSGEVNIGGFGGQFPILKVQGLAGGVHTGSTWSISANQDGIGRTILATGGQARAMYFENDGKTVHREESYFEKNVGIGTDSPGYTFTVYKSITNDWLALFGNTYNGAGNGVLIDAGDGSSGEILRLRDKDGNNKVHFLSNGNVGIGTDSPNAKLDINDGDFKNLKIIGANRLCTFRFQNAQSNFNNPDIVLFSNTTATGSYPQVSVHIKMHGRGFSANYSQFTEALATVELSTALIGLRSSIINHTTLGSAVSAGTFSISGTSLRFTPNRQTNYDTFSIEVNINSISVTYDT
tara:strand:+ start:1122 stop:2603 length:1482 start_codon:yes stop_codon:yes gene_type:complete